MMINFLSYIIICTMEKSWSPQYRSNLFFNPLVWVIGFIIAVLVCLVLYCIFKESLIFIGVVVYLGYVIVAYFERKRWEVNGYRTITIDRLHRMVVFDNKVKIPFQAITGVTLKVKEATDSVFTDGNNIYYNMLAFNGFLEFSLGNNEKISFAVQFRHLANEIVEALRDCALPVSASEAAKYEINGMTELAYVLLILGPIILWYLWKMFLR